MAGEAVLGRRAVRIRQMDLSPFACQSRARGLPKASKPCASAMASAARLVVTASSEPSRSSAGSGLRVSRSGTRPPRGRCSLLLGRRLLQSTRW